MKLSKLIAQLQEIEKQHGDSEVFHRGSTGRELFSVELAYHRVAEQDEYPKVYRMPEGFKFVLISN